MNNYMYQSRIRKIGPLQIEGARISGETTSQIERPPDRLQVAASMVTMKATCTGPNVVGLGPSFIWALKPREGPLSLLIGSTGGPNSF